MALALVFADADGTDHESSHGTVLWSYHKRLHMYPEWRKLMEDLIGAGAEQARHIVRIN